VMEYVDLSPDVISVDKMGGYWRVLRGGKIIRTFTCDDPQDRAMGYAMALLEGRWRIRSDD
jgi:hypothetical protein